MTVVRFAAPRLCAAQNAGLFCRSSGSSLMTKMVTLKWCVCFDCPTNDFHRAITNKQGVAMMTHLVMERLRQELYTTDKNNRFHVYPRPDLPVAKFFSASADESEWSLRDLCRGKFRRDDDCSIFAARAR